MGPEKVASGLPISTKRILIVLMMGMISFLMPLVFCSKDDSGAEKENTSVLQQNPSLPGSRNGEENIIDNPYLRPVKKPKIRRKK